MARLHSPVNILVCANVFASVFVSVIAIESYTYYENVDLGHSRQTNGTLTWGDFPHPVNKSGNMGEERSDGWDITVQFAVAIVDSVQTQAFPYDLLRRILKNDYSESEVSRYQTNVLVVTVVGGVLALAILLVVGVYMIRRCRRGGRDEFLLHLPPLLARYRYVALGLGAAFIIIDFIFVLCSMITSTQALIGALDLQQPVDDAMDDVTAYFQGMQKDYNFIAANTSQWFVDEVLISDCNEVGRLIWEAGRDEFLPLINTTFQLVADLDSKADECLGYLTTLNTNVQSALDTVVTGLDSVLTEVHFNLTNAVSDFSCIGCDGSCAGCSAIVPDDIFLNADFARLPNITSNINSLTSFLSTNTTGTSQDPSYYFLYGIGEQVTQDGNVTLAKDELIQGLLGWSNAWGNSTNNILYPNESVFWFDEMRPKWTEFYDDLTTREIVRYTFVVIFCVLTVAVMALTVVAVVVAAKAGVFTVDKSGDENFVKAKKLIGWSLVLQMTMAAAHMALAAAGFYAGANLEKAVCQPARHMGIAENVIDYPDGMPGHSGVYLSDVLLGNGSLAPLYLKDVLTSCSNGSTAYTVFLHQFIVPSLQDDLQNYTQHFNNLTGLFDRMRVGLPGDTTLVPPDFVTWVNNFTLHSNFNYTQFDNMLTGNVINADIDIYTANLQVIYNTDFASGGPFEPSKSRLPPAITLLQGQKSNVAATETLKNDLAAIFNDYTTSVNNILSVTNQTMEQLLALEPALINMSADAISKGVDQYMSEFMAAIDNAANTTWRWVGEAAPCQQISDSYDHAVTSFCDQYSDFVNASWLLLGHTSFFMLMISAISFIIYRAMPDPIDDALDVDAKTRISSQRNKDTDPMIAINTDTQKGKQGSDNKGFDFLGDLQASASPAPSTTMLPARFQKGPPRRIKGDDWMDHRRSLASPSGVVLQRNVMSIETLA